MIPDPDALGLSDDDKEIYLAELARLHRCARARPEHIWREYRAEIGPYEEISEASLREVLQTQSLDALLLGESDLLVPRAVAERMLEFLRRRLARLSVRKRGGQTKSWRNRRWEITAVEQFRAEKARLVAQGNLSTLAAEEQALETVAIRYAIKPETLQDWAKGRPQKRRKA